MENRKVKGIIELREELLVKVSGYEGKEFSKFPYNHFRVDYGYESGCDTDLYQCVIDNSEAEMRFSVEVGSEDGIIKKIGIYDCDVIVRGRVYDCIDLANEMMFQKVLSKVEKL